MIYSFIFTNEIIDKEKSVDADIEISDNFDPHDVEDFDDQAEIVNDLSIVKRPNIGDKAWSSCHESTKDEESCPISHI